MSNPDLARHLVACPRFRWMEGMVSTTGARLIASSPTHKQWAGPNLKSGETQIPDLDDPATVGCLLALVREALGHNGTSVLVEVRWSPTAPGWRIVRWDRAGSISIGLDDHPTEAAALVAALEAA